MEAKNFNGTKICIENLKERIAQFNKPMVSWDGEENVYSIYSENHNTEKISIISQTNIQGDDVFIALQGMGYLQGKERRERGWFPINWELKQ